MFQDSRQLARGSTQMADVCIVGAGIVGITLALELLDQGLDVLMLESGGLEPDPATDDLKVGASTGRRTAKLADTRHRGFGGTAELWAGMAAPLTPLDFEARSWVPHSGWPITRAELDPYYARAHKALGLGPFDYTAGAHADTKHPTLDFGPDARVESHVLQGAVARRDWGQTHHKALAASKKVRVLLHATATSIELNAAGTAVDHLAVAVPNGPTFKAKARRYVLAAGGLETPRLLLASRSVQSTGVGNAHDVVGRFFMDHPHTNDEGFLVGAPALRRWELYQRRRVGKKGAQRTVWGHFALTEATLRAEQLLRCHVVLFQEKKRRKRKRLTRAIPLKKELSAAIASTDGAGGEPGEAARGLFFTFGTPSEAAPNPDSRVVLSPDAVDSLGMPRLDLRWELSPLDLKSLRRTHEILAREIGRAGFGRMQLTLPDDGSWPRTSGARHHMGTARMASDPSEGVVDADARVHGVANLHVAGCAVFPTSGAAPPTLTAMALAIRLGDHLTKADR